jgi:E3 ubiquitin-protein ligase DOA10
MPDTIPFWILAKRVIDTLAKGIKLILRAILVTSIWLVILPYFTIWIWRLYFWVGDWFAFSANGLGVPNMYIENATTVATNATEQLAASGKATEEWGSFTRLVQQTIPPEHKWLRYVYSMKRLVMWKNEEGQKNTWHIVFDRYLAQLDTWHRRKF